MSSRKYNSYGTGNNHNKNAQRGSNRERHQRQRPIYEEKNDSRAVQILRRILNDDDEANFNHRITNATQLLKLMEESRTIVASDSLQFRQEQMKLLDICIHDERLQRAIEMPKAPLAMKQVFVNLVSGLACYTRLDLALSWIFDRLTVWPSVDISAVDIRKDREWKKWLLNLLKQILVDSAADQYTYRQAFEMSPTILAGVISFLDTMDSSEYLPVIIDIFSVISEQYPDLFDQRFTDIIDLLVGWNMDENIPDAKKSILISTYGKFNRFWANHIPFAMELLGHLLSDIESIISELRSLYRKDMKEYKQKWESCTTVLSCYRTMLKTIIPFISEVQAYRDKNIVETSFDVMLPKTLHVVTDALTLLPDISWIEMSRDILLLIVSHCPLKYRQFQYQIYLYLGEQTELESSADPIKYIEILMQFINLWQSDIDKEVFQRMLDVNISPLFALRQKYPENKKLKKSILVLLRYLIRTGTANEGRAHINQKLVEHLEKKKASIQGLPTEKEVVPKRFSKTMNLLEHHHCAFQYENSSTRISANPAIVEEILFFNYFLLDIALVWKEYQLRNLLISANTLCMAWTYRRGDLFAPVLQMLFNYWSSLSYMWDDENGFNTMSCIISDMLDYWVELTLNSRQMLCELVQSILTSVCNMETIQLDITAHLKPIISGFLFAAGIERNRDIKESVLNLITYYCQLCGSIGTLDSVLQLVQRSINDPHPKIQDASKDLVVSLNPFLISNVTKLEDNAMLSLQNTIMATPHTGSFRPVHYEIVMKQLGMGKHLLGSNDTSKIDYISTTEWARRLFHHCDTLGNMKNISLFTELHEDMPMDEIIDLIDNSEVLMHYWAMWESARYCILSRLRTPFGNPQQTLAAFERTLSSFVTNEEETDSDKNSLLQHLLLLLNRLELQILNASDGCATGTLPAVPRPSLVFFRTNKKTCQDYFSRIRPNMIKGAKLARSDDLMIVNIMKALKEMETNMSSNPVLWFKEVNGYVRDLVEVYIKKKYTDMIYGLQSWYKKIICKAYQMFPEFKENWSFEGYIGPLNKSLGTNDNTKVSWFQTAALFASGRDELAIKSLSTLRSLGTIDEHGILHMLARQAIDFYTCLEDYHSIGDILTSAPENNFIYQALHAFNSGEETLKNQEDAFREMQNFVKVAPLEACTKLNRLDDFRHWLVPDAEKNDDITSQITSRMLHTLKDGIFSNITNLLELQLLFTGWEHLVASARDWYDSEVAVNSTLHPVSETKHWARLCTEFEQLYHLNGGAQADSVVTQYMNSIYLHTAKVARRQGNMLLAEKLIEKAAQAPDTKYRALYERTKILFSQSAYAEAMDTLNTIMTHVASVPEYKELASRTYRNIARYLKSSPEDKATSLLEKLDPNFVKRVATEMQSPVEACIDNALEKSIETNTTDGRPWFEYATHHYKQGWRILEEILQPEPTIAIAVWAKAEIQKNLTYADDTVDKKQLEKMIFELLINYSSSIGNDSSSSCHSLVSGLRQLVPFLKPENETNIISIYDILHKMVIDKFYASAQAYFRYLSLDIHISHNDEVSNTSMVTTATLRLLRILSKYGTALQSIYCEHIDTVRIDLWKRVTPQLFAQLNHPNEFIRQVISKLICRICDEYPREIIYDVIVSSSSSKTNKDTKQALDIIANRMIERNELLWVSTSRMAEEIQRMTILVEEHMMNMIGDLQFDVMGNFTDLDVEIAQLETSNIKEEAEKEKIFFELYDNCMKPIISAIDKFMAAIHGLEISEILTPHQRWFVRMYGKEILDAFLLLQKPKSIKEYREGWECFQQLHRTLMEETHKVRVLELSEVSPYLYNLKNTSIGMPGHSDLDCYIDSFGSNVIVIPTKTKPKKLDFKGSDGKKYPYLFKGHEDLHLDERIMQLLTTTNGLLNENETTALRGMRARTYAVIPLRDRSGMIQWVNEATPLYALFKKWQKRESAAHMVLNNDKPNEAILHALSMRPTENFANKVYAALKAAGLRVSTNRRHWPKHILKKVYLELVKETPGDLLEKELYYSSSTAEEWINKSTSFARSLAVTSMIGYIIGLGDRHLDNMLVDFRSGEMIHIDYNVCFEKGRRLRVPELVPYRLTQNLHNALGIMGIDGPFRTAAEETLMVLRKHKEVLITLLDAFVYDPLVDWEYEAEEAGHRQMRELQRSLGLVATHINRNQTQLEHDHQTVAKELAALEENLHRWQIFGNDYLNEEEESEEEEDRDEQPATDQNENETAVYRVPSYILSKVRERLSCVKFIVTRSRSPLEGILPLLESIIIIEADEDNELRPAQKASKTVFDALTRMDSQLKKLEKQIETNQNYESDWTYAQLADFIKLIQTSYVEYCSSLKILEEFGPDSKASSTSVVPVTDEPKSEAVEDNDTEYTDDQNNEAAESQTNKLPKITHVAKIMKRIRSKLEGVDFGVQHRMSVSEQVSKTIEQATSADNLCLMYEGWTSWV